MGVLELIEQFEIDYYPLSYEQENSFSKPANSSSGFLLV